MKIILGLLLIALISLGARSVQDIPQKTVSFGAPVSSTGAPDERTCAESGCHDTYAPNSPRGSMNITIDGAENGIEAGKTYTVTVRVTDNDSRRFGYQLVALHGDKTNAGTMVIVDPERTQIMTNELKLQDRQYATYTYAGTEQFTRGVGEWSVQWTAPLNVDNITLYAATVIANDDDTDHGDYVLTSSLPLAPKLLNCIVDSDAPTSWFMVKNTQEDVVSCAFTLDHPGEVSLAMVDLSGRIYPLGSKQLEAGFSVQDYPVTGIARGVYILRATSDFGSTSHTIILP